MVSGMHLLMLRHKSSLSTIGKRDLVGEKYWVGIDHYHVLKPSALRFLIPARNLSEEMEESIHLASLLVRSSHGSAAVLGMVKDQRHVAVAQQAFNKKLEAIANDQQTNFEIKVREGDANAEITQELQEGFYDGIILERETAQLPANSRSFYQLVRKSLVFGRVPVLIAGKPSKCIDRMLICTAAGEPGKAGIRFGGRLARHIKASATVFHAIRKRGQEENLVVGHLEKALDLLEAYDVSAELKLVRQEGEVASRLLEEILTGKYDMVVVGASFGKTRESKELISEVIVKTDSTVVIVPSFI